jgi:hypothetical protein
MPLFCLFFPAYRWSTVSWRRFINGKWARVEYWASLENVDIQALVLQLFLRALTFVWMCVSPPKEDTHDFSTSTVDPHRIEEVPRFLASIVSKRIVAFKSMYWLCPLCSVPCPWPSYTIISWKCENFTHDYASFLCSAANEDYTQLCVPMVSAIATQEQAYGYTCSSIIIVIVHLTFDSRCTMGMGVEQWRSQDLEVRGA